MSSKAWIIFGAICVIVFGGLVVYSGRDRVDVTDVDASKIQSASEDSGKIADQVFGNKDAKVVLIEYGDFQCPGCGSAHPVLKSVTEKYQENLAFVFRNFPLTQIHPNARAAAAAVEAAGLQGKYWQMHNLVFETQNEWKDASAVDRGTLFGRYAQQIGLDEAKFNKSLEEESTRINKKINFDLAVGRKVKVSSTPTFFLNGKLLETDAYNGQEALEKTLLAEFKKQGIDVSKTETITDKTPQE